MWSQGQWGLQKNASDGADRYTDGHCDSKTELADLVKRKQTTSDTLTRSMRRKKHFFPAKSKIVLMFVIVTEKKQWTNTWHQKVVRQWNVISSETSQSL